MEFIQPKRLPEANIVAEFYRRCRESGLDCYLGYGAKLNGTGRRVRFDAVILQNHKIKAIVEIKSYSTNRPMNLRTKQLAKYSQFGLPIFWITRLNQVQSVIQEIIKYLDEGD